MNEELRQRLQSLFAVTGPADWLATGALILVAQFEIWVEPVFQTGLPGPRPALAVLALLALVPLAWRRRAPLPVLLLMVTGFMLIGIVGEREQSGFELALALILAVYSVAAHGDTRQAAIGAAVVLAGSSVFEALTWVEGDAAVDVIVPYLLFAAAWIAGREVAHGRARAATLATRAEMLEEERRRGAERAVAEERSRIARELHDVVSHGISIMGLQAAAARRTLAPEQTEQRDALLTVERIGREALEEMRRMLGVLRGGTGEASREPLPALSDLPALIEDTRRTELEVDSTTEGAPRDLPAGLELTAYRIIQEALTNVRKHAPGARASVTLRYSECALDIVVADNGPSSRAGPGDDGHGLAGMKERAALHGGEVRAGPGKHGGFVVEAHLPVDR